MRKQFLVVTLSGVVLAGMGLAAAVVAAPTPEESPEAGRFPLPLETIEAHRAARFAEVDTNGDGLVSRAEFDAHAPPRGRPHKGAHRPHPPGGWHHPAPGPEAGGARSAELDAALFQALDANGDGVLSADEFSQESLAAARKSQFKARAFAHMDTDGDGYLSPEEFPPQRLSELDANADGEISRDEFHRRDRHPAG